MIRVAICDDDGCFCMASSSPFVADADLDGGGCRHERGEAALDYEKGLSTSG